jgi:hypothetical protein
LFGEYEMKKAIVTYYISLFVDILSYFYSCITESHSRLLVVVTLVLPSHTVARLLVVDTLVLPSHTVARLLVVDTIVLSRHTDAF